MSKRTNGEGSYVFIKKRNQWRWTMMYDDITGKPQIKTLYSKNLQKLKMRVNEWLSDYRQGKISAGDNVKLTDWVQIWLERVVKPSCKEKTYQNYKTTAHNHMLPLFGKLLLQKITTVQLQNYFNELLKSRNARTVVTIRRHFICCFSAAIKFGFLSINPAKLTAAPRIGPRKTMALTEEQVRKIEK